MYRNDCLESLEFDTPYWGKNMCGDILLAEHSDVEFLPPEGKSETLVKAFATN
jgi:hypothetical protein